MDSDHFVLHWNALVHQRTGAEDQLRKADHSHPALPKEADRIRPCAHLSRWPPGLTLLQGNQGVRTRKAGGLLRGTKHPPRRFQSPRQSAETLLAHHCRTSKNARPSRFLNRVGAILPGYPLVISLS